MIYTFFFSFDLCMYATTNDNLFIQIIFAYFHDCFSRRPSQCVYRDGLYDLNQSSDRGQHTEKEKRIMLGSRQGT